MNHAAQKTTASSSGVNEFINSYTTDLATTIKDPIIGRNNEIERLIEILGRKSKCCPVLTGLAGVGKTAVVEGLVHKILSGDVPDFLTNKKILELELGLFSGQDALLKLQILLEEFPEDAILFIDEIHTVVGAGRMDGALDAANLLKPLLARGDLKLIGATTPEEYRRYIEKDSALERRFQAVNVDAPSIKDTIKILEGLRERYECHHNIKIGADAIQSAVELSDRYITDRQLPDKAFDLLDQACSHLSIQAEKYRKSADIMKKLQDECNWEELSEYKYGVLPTLESRDILNKNDIAEVVSRWKGIAIEDMTSSEASKLLHMASHLKTRVKGQDNVLDALSGRIQASRVGLVDEGRPQGSFLFLGPTGTGKTETAKAVAEFLFGTEDSMIRIDCSELMEKHSVSKLIGAPAGYIGYEDGGQLTDAVKRKPYSLILFDEVEKAHPDVFNLLLQVLDEGHLQDSHGVRVDFKNTFIVFTSNLQETQLKEFFRPEFLNRIDEILTFNSLSKDVIKEILDSQLVMLQTRVLKTQGIRFEVSDLMKEFLCDKGYDSEYGARPLKRLIHTLIERVLSEKILNGEISKGSFIIIKGDSE